ncbi:MAG: glycosyl hydrolase family 18 protein [Actinobacteria bacterium]|nr:glycosyl hydrolase family 18 protein [Actinomycetota bacterium]
MMNFQRNVMAFIRRSFSAAVNSLAVPRAIALAVIIAMAGQLVPSANAEPAPRKILSGWIPYYGMSTSLPTAVANADLINEVMPFWYTVKLNTKTKAPYILDLYTPGNPSVAIDIPLATMRSAGFKIIPTITDGTDKLVLAKLLAKSSDRASVIKPIVDLVMNKNFDGIDLDFEGFAFVDGTESWPTTKPNWVLFVKELSAALHANGKLLSITAPVHFALTEKQKGYTVYAWAEIAPFIDRLRIMTYDYSTSKPGPIGPIAWVERTVQYAISVMPATKIYIGLAGYGRDWVTKVDGICPDNVAKVVSPTAKAATFIMRNAATLASTYGVTPTYNEQYQEATFTYQKTYNGNNADGQATSCTATRTAWYQNAASYLARAQLVAKYRLGGLAEWTMGMEEQSATDGIRSTAQTIAPDEVLLSLATDQTAAKYGSFINLTGQATLKDKSILPGLPVYLEFKGFDESTWREIGKPITTDTGSFASSIYLAKSGKLRVTSEGSWQRGAGLSSETSVTVNPRLNITAPTSAKAGITFKVIVSAAPTTTGTQVALRRFDGKVWNTVSLVPLLATGTELSQIELVRGVYSYRVLVFDNAESAESTSAPFIVVVR